MKKIYSTHITAIIFILIAVSISSCSKKNNPNPTPQSNDVISSLSVSTGPYTTAVTITGNGFSAVPTDQQVFFNGKPATITAATTTQLTTSVPLAAGTGAITIKYKDGVTVKGPNFTYQVALVATTFAGSGVEGYADGPGVSAMFDGPMGMVTDKAGNIFVADLGNNRIRKITPDGTVSTFAGSGVAGASDGVGTAATFNHPDFIAMDSSGDFFVTDGENNPRIRKISSSGVVTTYAGSYPGYQDGAVNTAQFGTLYGIAVDSNDNVYVCDVGTKHIRKVTADGQVSTVGKGVLNFDYPFQIMADHLNNIYMSNLGDQTIRKITPAGTITYVTNLDGTSNFKGLQGMTIDANGTIYAADEGVIKKIVNDKVVINYAGNLSLDLPIVGPVAGVSIFSPQGIVVDGAGNLYLAQSHSGIISKISTQ